MGIYIVAISALFFLAFAYFAVGQAAVNRNGSQTAADAAALAAAREARDEMKAPFLAALTAGDIDDLGRLLLGDGVGDAGPCAAAADYANLNHATRGLCNRVGNPLGYAVTVINQRSVGNSVISGTDAMHASAHATAVVEARCGVLGKDGDAIHFSCIGEPDVDIDPTDDGFTLDLSMFYSVHLTS
ncbi:pilus assembly protein TadG-related protein [Streptomyces sp. NBC_01190]|uniref:pilus assembly protein TadG-related protein n=1 Tax=Streptomyces sp. NBC_01190 TaxID=2903767 RepID=UPI00386BE81E|nr:pilus assembly protein TadG-related protein [Streptomyces sp. NBC_01190]